jgi:phosphomannomutase/phosphoglucomutase
MYDIRGSVGDEINAEFALLLGRAYGSYLASTVGQNRWVVVGRDNRPSSEELHASLCRGLISTGCNVLDIGLSPTPLMNFTVVNWNLSGGVNITGSHSPPDKNGFKLVGAGAYPVADDDIRCLLHNMQKQNFVKGNGLIAKMSPGEAYIEKMLSLIFLKRPLTVAVDAGNGTAGFFIVEILRRFGCDVIDIYCEPDGDFPNHIPNPENRESLRIIQKIVVNCNADIGLAFDGDGDRLGVIDEKGEQCAPEEVIILLSRDLLNRIPESKVIIDVKSSQTAIDEISLYGGIPVLWKTGHSLIKRKMHRDGILLAGEASGHYFTAENYYPIDDAILASCRLLEYLSSQKFSLSTLCAPVKKRSQEYFEVPCPDDDKNSIISSVQEYYSRNYPTIVIDGARIQMEGGWALVRASNTAPALSIKFEAETDGEMELIKKEIFSYLEKFPSIKLPIFTSE